jgi:hypothetical protein
VSGMRRARWRHGAAGSGHVGRRGGRDALAARQADAGRLGSGPSGSRRVGIDIPVGSGNLG